MRRLCIFIKLILLNQKNIVNLEIKRGDSIINLVELKRARFRGTRARAKYFIYFINNFKNREIKVILIPYYLLVVFVNIPHVYTWYEGT